MSNEEYDVVVVGAGSAGCVLANRLTKDPGLRVLLLEAGGSDRHPAVAVPKGFAFTMQNPARAWSYPTEPFGPFGQVESWSRGRMLGGSSSINGMVYNRGSRADFDALEALGNPGWGWDEILRIYRGMEDHSLGASDMRGSGGPLGVSIRTDPDEVDELLIAAAEKLSIARVRDLNSTDAERVGYTPATIRGGLRVSAARAFLRPALRRPNLTLRTGVHVTRLQYEGHRVAGVEGMAEGAAVQFRARREVILSAGAIATPHLLELSGIGAPDVLKSAGIEVRVESPKIGEGAHEHRTFPLQVRLIKDIGYNHLLSTRTRQGMSGLRWLLTRKGADRHPGLRHAGLREKLSGRRAARRAGTPCAVQPGGREQPYRRRGTSRVLAARLRAPPHQHGQHPRPLGRPGRATLHRAKLPLHLARPHHLSRPVPANARDRPAVPIAEVAGVEIQPGLVAADDEAILASGYLYGGPGFHACGTVSMGPNPDDPVDSRLRVRGVGGLRVMDVSVNADDGLGQPERSRHGDGVARRGTHPQ